MRSTDITRRSFIASAAALPLAAATTGQTISPVMARLSSYMAAAGQRALPEEALEQTKQHILDTFAAMVSGSELPPGMLRDQVCARAFRREGRDRRGVRCGLRGDRSRDSPTRCSRTRTKPTIRTRPRNRIPDAPIVPVGACGRGAIQYRWAAICCAPSHSATTSEHASR